MNLVNQRLMSVCYRLPVIFLKDVSSKDFERLLWYMYKGEVRSRITRDKKYLLSERSLELIRHFSKSF